MLRVKVYAASKRVKLCATVDVNHLLKIVSGFSRVAISGADTVGVTIHRVGQDHLTNGAKRGNRIGEIRAMEWLDRFWRNLPT